MLQNFVLAVALLLYACGYVTQFIGNLCRLCRKNGGMLGGTFSRPLFPSFVAAGLYSKVFLWFPYNLYCTASCAAACRCDFSYTESCSARMP